MGTHIHAQQAHRILTATVVVAARKQVIAHLNLDLSHGNAAGVAQGCYNRTKGQAHKGLMARLTFPYIYTHTPTPTYAYAYAVGRPDLYADPGCTGARETVSNPALREWSCECQKPTDHICCLSNVWLVQDLNLISHVSLVISFQPWA